MGCWDVTAVPLQEAPYGHTGTTWLTLACLCLPCSPWPGLAQGELPRAGQPPQGLCSVGLVICVRSFRAAVLTELSRAELLPFEHRRSALVPHPPLHRGLLQTEKFPRHRAGRKNNFHLIRFV